MSDPPPDRFIFDERILELLKKALREANIAERDIADQFPSLFGGTNFYWQEINLEVGDDIVLVFSLLESGGLERFCGSISVYGLAQEAANFFPNDSDVVKALVDSFSYIRTEISELLRRTHQGLNARGFNLSNQRLGQERDPLSKAIRSEFIDPIDSDSEAKRRKIKKQLSGTRGRGAPTKRPPAGLKRDVIRAASKILRSGDEPKLSNVAAGLGLKEQALSKDLKRKGISWRDIKAALKNRDKNMS